ncbi:hypothetical protein [Kribbella sp. NBC_00889]|uniref:hypothetical protein n=1 Tax=Kribbella sp. NBC_00889 TaxID=2975974 RepID=UPI00386457D8|nr:hypothetical protein OG817_27050 [Kribbella sp. NBC_00889]
MKRAIVWVLSVAGIAAVVWLLLGAPASGSKNSWPSNGGGPLTECKSVLRTGGAIPVRGVLDPIAVETLQGRPGEPVGVGRADCRADQCADLDRSPPLEFVAGAASSDRGQIRPRSMLDSPTQP